MLDQIILPLAFCQKPGPGLLGSSLAGGSLIYTTCLAGLSFSFHLQGNKHVRKVFRCFYCLQAMRKDRKGGNGWGGGIRVKGYWDRWVHLVPLRQIDL